MDVLGKRFLAGVYVYPVTGQEKKYTLGAESPQGIDLDIAGNIYVVNNNSTYDSGETLDTARNVGVLAHDGTLLRRIGYGVTSRGLSDRRPCQRRDVHRNVCEYGAGHRARRRVHVGPRRVQRRAVEFDRDVSDRHV